MKRIFSIIIAASIFSLPIIAQQNPADAPATQADVERYLQVMHSREMMNQMVDAMLKPMHKMIHDQYVQQKDNLPPDFEARMNKTMDDMMKDMPWQEMLDAMAPAYQKHFTKGDIDALIAFYSSPTGQKVLRETPSLMADSMDAMMPIMRKHIDKISQRTHEEMLAMLKESEKAPSASQK
jgi:hypothetical protein